MKKFVADSVVHNSLDKIRFKIELYRSKRTVPAREYVNDIEYILELIERIKHVNGSIGPRKAVSEL